MRRFCEVIAQNIMASTNENIPVLTIAFDENLEKIGIIARLEAFLDAARNYKQNKKNIHNRNKLYENVFRN